MTINKSQGQSLKHCGILLSRSVFTHGQLYVAASRVGDPAGLRFHLASDDCHTDKTDQHHHLTRNVVFTEVL
jgi:ATP-dependent DNA helicase PIF1